MKTWRMHIGLGTFSRAVGNEIKSEHVKMSI